MLVLKNIIVIFLFIISFHLNLYYCSASQMTAKIKIQFIDYWYVILFFLLVNIIFLILFLNSLNFILNHSGIGVQSMHNRNFLFSYNILYGIKITFQ